MGKYIRPLSDAVFTIASDDLWIESLAIQQLHTTANLPNMQRVVGIEVVKKQNRDKKKRAVKSVICFLKKKKK